MAGLQTLAAAIDLQSPSYYYLQYMKWFPYFLLHIILTTSSGNYKKIIHNSDPEAKCLDGSPGLLYVHEGGDPAKILIFFQGGGLCGDETLEKSLQNCFQRTKNLLGSSKYWPEQLTPEVAQGYLSTDAGISAFAGWTKFIFGYCDGSLHQGYAAEPVAYKGTSIYFRGAAITRSHFDWIDRNYGLKRATKIIVTGGSAGGIAVSLWSNFVKQLVNDASSVFPIADSGVFIDFKAHTGVPHFQNCIKNTFKLANIQENTPLRQCNELYQSDQWKCLLIEHAYPTIRGKFMIINSEYDSWAIPNILSINCLSKAASAGLTLTNCSSSQKQYIQKYRSAYLEFLAAFISSNPESSIWSIACSNHVYACLGDFYSSPLQRIPEMVGKTVKEAVEEFALQEKRVVSIDLERWPSNGLCAR